MSRARRNSVVSNANLKIFHTTQPKTQPPAVVQKSQQHKIHRLPLTLYKNVFDTIFFNITIMLIFSIFKYYFIQHNLNEPNQSQTYLLLNCSIDAPLDVFI